MAGTVETLKAVEPPTLLHKLARRTLFIPSRLGYDVLPRIASTFRKWWTIARNPHATIKFGKGCYLGPRFSLHIPAGGEFIVGDNVEFRRNFRCEVWNGRLTIGSGSFITYDVLIQCSTSIEIGERVGIGHCSSVYDGSHRFRDTTVPFRDQGYNFRPLRIGNDAAIHSQCTIVNDIGERAVIGAGAVVSRPVPAYTLAVGAPAKPIDYFGPAGQEPEELRERLRTS